MLHDIFFPCSNNKHIHSHLQVYSNNNHKYKYIQTIIINRRIIYHSWKKKEPFLADLQCSGWCGFGCKGSLLATEALLSIWGCEINKGNFY